MPPQSLATLTRAPKHSDLRGKLTRINYYWIPGSLWLWTITGAALTRFAQGLEMPEKYFGILAALPFIGSMLQLPASYFLEKHSLRLKTTIYGIFASRSCWILIGLVPWVLPKSLAWPAMIVLVGLSWATLNFGVPGWISWMADLVPERIRGRFIGNRRRLSLLVGVVSSLCVGELLELSEDQTVLLAIISAIFIIAGICGVIEATGYLREFSPDKPKPDEHIKWFSNLSKPFKTPGFRPFIAFNILFTLGLAFINQYIWLYCFNRLNFSNSKANLLLVTIPLLLQSVSFTYWGKIIDHMGKKQVLIIAGMISTISTLGWLLCDPNNIWLGYAIVMISVLTWAGIDLSNFNILISIAGTKKEGSIFIAVNSLVAAITGGVSGLLAAYIASKYETLTFTIPAISDHPFGYIAILFILSVALRVVAFFFIFFIDEPKDASTLDTIRFMTTSLYSNLRQAVFMPSRVAISLKNRTYVLTKHVKK
ncbi:MFS transporter [Planctomycetota bacterium]|nr:MFS transporter [Planctomycetota bacterium]